MTTLKEFKVKYPICPYCGEADFTNKPSRPQDITCWNCWSAEFGCQFWFEHGGDDAAFTGFRLYNGTHEAWFHIKWNNFYVLIVDQGPISDNPVKDRLGMECYVRGSEFTKLLDKQYAVEWLNNKTEEIFKGHDEKSNM